tara:strand:- start:1970 stop:2305 length:336 start_codon:yes stop_codon:yes gene_type:complete
MDRIILIAQQIAKEGKTPNTAMIKARLPKNVPLPAIIQGLKLWHENPNREIVASTESLTTTNAETEMDRFEALLNTKVEALVEAKVMKIIKPLENEIRQLKFELKALKENQ